MSKKIIYCDEFRYLIPSDDLLGSGAHKDVYFDYKNPKRCIKILKYDNDEDYRREYQYRKILDILGRDATLLPEYYGKIATNLGVGFVFELIRDFDNRPSMPIDKYLMYQSLLASDEIDEFNRITTILRIVKEEFLNGGIVTTSMECGNILIQRISPKYDDIQLKIVDNIGTHAFIPMQLIFPRLALRHNRKYWERFMDEMHEQHPDLVNSEVIRVV